MNTKIISAFIFIGFICCDILAISLPHYIKRCSRKSKDFDKCALNHAKYAIPYLAEGDRTFRIPNMKPLHITSVSLDAGNFKLDMFNISVYGMERIVPISLRADFEKRIVELVSTIDVVNIEGFYKINGRILVIPIIGEGSCKIVFYGGVYTYKFHYDLVQKKGKEFAKLNEDKSVFDYDMKNVSYDFKNLFNGDERLGNEMNKFMNENWREIDKDLRAPFLKTLLAIYNNFAKNLWTRLPFDEMFLD